ncbi:unnamed protein product, partial [Pylaiella littoralis]
CGEESHPPSGAPCVSEAAPSPRAGLSAVPTPWGQDSGDGSARGSTSKPSPPQSGTVNDHDDIPIDTSAGSRNTVSSSWGDDSSEDDGKKSATVHPARVLPSRHAGALAGPAELCTATWGDDSDDDDDDNDDDRKGGRVIRSCPPTTSLMPPSSQPSRMMTAAVGFDEHTA